MSDEPNLFHTGVYDDVYGRLEMAFAVRELAALEGGRARPVHLTTVEVRNSLDFDSILIGAADMMLEQEAWGGDRDTMAGIVATILDAVMVGDGDADNPAAGGFAYSWAEDGSHIEIDYDPLTIRLMPGGAVRVSASG